MKRFTRMGVMVLATTVAACGGGGGSAGGGTDSGPPGAAQLSAATYSVAEGTASVAIRVGRTGGSSGTLDVTLRTEDGTAVAGQDYTATTQTLTFANNDTREQTVTIAIADDSQVEGNETFTVTASSPTATSSSAATVTIQDDDVTPPGVVQFGQATYNVIDEQRGFVIVDLVRTGSNDGDVTVQVATSEGTARADADYTTTQATVTFYDGQDVPVLLVIPITIDHPAEPEETFTLTLSSPTGGATLGAISTAEVIIPANDDVDVLPPAAARGTLQFSSGTYTVTETGVIVTVTVTRVGGSTGAIAAVIRSTDGTATAGVDYGGPYFAGVTFPDGDTQSKTFDILIVNDQTAAEPNETFTLALSEPIEGTTFGSPSSAVITIVDSPSAPVLTLSATAKRLHFSWPSVPNTASYKLYFKPGAAAFTQVGADLPASATGTDIDVAAHRLDWRLAAYRLEACNANGCTTSADVSPLSEMLKAIGYLKAAGPDVADRFGASIAMSSDGDTIAIGAPGDDSNAVDVDGDSADDSIADSGAVYVYARTDAVWSQQAYLKASTVEAGIEFGGALALSSDGSTLVIGAKNANSTAGAAYLFSRAGSTWSAVQVLTASNGQSQDSFGAALAIDGTGDVVAVGAPAEASDATGVDGVETNRTTTRAGAVFLFERTGAAWSQAAHIKATNTGTLDEFGTALALNEAGTVLAVGAPGEASNAATIGGDQGDNNAPEAGAVYVYSRAASWIPSAYLKADSGELGDHFGGAVSFNGAGDMLAVGATGEDSPYNSPTVDSAACSADILEDGCDSGAVYVFTHDGGSWSQHSYLKGSTIQQDDGFGGALALSSDGNTLAVGARAEDGDARGLFGDESIDSAPGAGAVYVFNWTSSFWLPDRYVKASNTQAGDEFGIAVALSGDGDTLAVGAHHEDSNAAGLDGNQNDDSLDNAGAAYLY